MSRGTAVSGVAIEMFDVFCSAGVSPTTAKQGT
jgi:hypothetical protein